VHLVGFTIERTLYIIYVQCKRFRPTLGCSGSFSLSVQLILSYCVQGLRAYWSVNSNSRASLNYFICSPVSHYACSSFTDGQGYLRHNWELWELDVNGSRYISFHIRKSVRKNWQGMWTSVVIDINVNWLSTLSEIFLKCSDKTYEFILARKKCNSL